MSTEALPEDLTTLKVVELKEVLRERGLPVSGTKAQLIARLEENAPTPSTDQQQPTPLNEDDSTPATTTTDKKRSPSPRVEAEVNGNKRQKVDEGGDDEMDQLPTTTTTAPSFDSAPAVLDVHAPETQPELVETTNGNGTGKQENGTEQTTVVEELLAQEEPTEGQQEIEEEEEEPPEYNFEPETIDTSSLRPTDMYLDTIDRSSLDFDFERLCSVTLSHNNIYCCLVDGKFFQGRGKKSAAYAHSIGEDHHVFINLETRKVYVLPDGYEVSDPSLSDIQYLLSPTFTPSLLSSIDRRLTPHHDLTQSPYYPGFVGVNNIKSNSYINSVLVSLAHVVPLRDYFILNPACTGLPSTNSNSSSSSSVPPTPASPTELVKRFSLFLRKIWNPRQFKNQVSPHELLQQIDLDSKGKFKLNDQGSGDPQEFLGWFLNTLHRDLGGNRRVNSSIIYSTFQGELRVDDQQVLKSGEYGSKPKFDLDRDIKTTRTPFLYLTLDLPPPPLFQSHLQNDIIPQVSLQTLLSKYNGQTTSELLQPTKEGAEGKSELTLRRFKLEKLPEFVVLCVKRFMSNRFGEEKNPTIVNFPLRGVDFKEYVEAEDTLEKYYDLVSNVTHTSLAGTARSETQWKTYVHLKPARDENDNYLPVPINEEGGGGGKVREVKEEDEKWFEMQDLNVGEIEKGLVGLGESYIQIWERRRPRGEHGLKVETPKQKVKGVAGQVSQQQQGATSAKGKEKQK